MSASSGTTAALVSREARAGDRDLGVEGSDNGGQLVSELVEGLRREGAPAGVWLVKIAQVRRALQSADDLLLELQDAVIDSLPPLDDMAG